jgi:hypothetical protein
VVPKGGLEPPRVAPHAPQACVSTRFHHFGSNIIVLQGVFRFQTLQNALANRRRTARRGMKERENMSSRWAVPPCRYGPRPPLAGQVQGGDDGAPLLVDGVIAGHRLLRVQHVDLHAPLVQKVQGLLRHLHRLFGPRAYDEDVGLGLEHLAKVLGPEEMPLLPPPGGVHPVGIDDDVRGVGAPLDAYAPEGIGRDFHKTIVTGRGGMG